MHLKYNINYFAMHIVCINRFYYNEKGETIIYFAEFINYLAVWEGAEKMFEHIRFETIEIQHPLKSTWMEQQNAERFIKLDPNIDDFTEHYTKNKQENSLLWKEIHRRYSNH